LLDSHIANDCHVYGDPTFGDGNSPSLACTKTWAQIEYLMKDLNIYDLYRYKYPVSLLERSEKIRNEGRMGSSIVGGEVKTYKRGMTMSEYTPWLNRGKINENEPILGDYFTDYMNREDVRAAFNIPTSVQAWEQCTNAIDYHELDECSMWIYPILKG
jgi:hypothetical protein